MPPMRRHQKLEGIEREIDLSDLPLSGVGNCRDHFSGHPKAVACVVPGSLVSGRQPASPFLTCPSSASVVEL